MTLNDWATLIAIITGVVGAMLGGTNFLLRFLEKRVRLRVVPQIAFDVGQNIVMTGDRPMGRFRDYLKGGKTLRLCVEITNLSEFPITVAQVGFSRKGRHQDRLHFVVPDVTPSSKSWPVRLDPRESCTVYAEPSQGFDALLEHGPLAFCETDCGCTVYGTSLIIKHIIDAIRSTHSDEE